MVTLIASGPTSDIRCHSKPEQHGSSCSSHDRDRPDTCFIVGVPRHADGHQTWLEERPDKLTCGRIALNDEGGGAVQPWRGSGAAAMTPGQRAMARWRAGDADRGFGRSRPLSAGTSFREPADGIPLRGTRWTRVPRVIMLWPKPRLSSTLHWCATSLRWRQAHRTGVGQVIRNGQPQQVFHQIHP